MREEQLGQRPKGLNLPTSQSRCNSRTGSMSRTLDRGQSGLPVLTTERDKRQFAGRLRGRRCCQHLRPVRGAVALAGGEQGVLRWPNGTLSLPIRIMPKEIVPRRALARVIPVFHQESRKTGPLRTVCLAVFFSLPQFRRALSCESRRVLPASGGSRRYTLRRPNASTTAINRTATPVKNAAH
jgi:hypothetical protein